MLTLSKTFVKSDGSTTILVLSPLSAASKYHLESLLHGEVGIINSAIFNPPKPKVRRWTSLMILARYFVVNACSGPYGCQIIHALQRASSRTQNWHMEEVHSHQSKKTCKNISELPFARCTFGFFLDTQFPCLLNVQQFAEFSDSFRSG